ncbi:MAG: hypothetical protein RSE58_07700, partial [Clostridia bacterium]
MRKTIRPITAVILLLTILCSAMVAFGESKYVSIKDIRETIPERWTGEYTVRNGAHKQLKKGDTVSIDVPIVVPEVDTVPVVRITWDPPTKELDESFEITDNFWFTKTIGHDFPKDEMGFPLLEDNVTFVPELPWEDAPAIAINELQKWLPFMKDKELTCYFQRSYGNSMSNGFQCLCFYTSYHGIPHLIAGDYFWREVKSEYGPESEDRIVASVPSCRIAMRIKRPGQFWVNIDTSKEVVVDIEDIPLLPFEKILKVLEQQVEEGYAYSLNELRFGYMGFIDPEKKGEEFVLMPVWAAKGRTRSDLTLPFDLKTDQAVKDYAGYFSREIIVINAQTGGTYDFANDARPDRRYVPHIITWDEVK